MLQNVVDAIVRLIKNRVGYMGTVIIVIVSLLVGGISSAYFKSGDNPISDIAEEIVQAETGVNPDPIDDAIGADVAAGKKQAASK